MNINTLDLNLLRVFDAVYTERNVSRAATKLAITQPAISNAVTRLRRALGDPLFVRTQRGMEPTAAALRFAPAIGEALRILRTSLAEPVTFDPKTSTKVYRFLTSDAGGALVLPQLMARLQSEAPCISVETIQAPHSAYAEMLEQNNADFALGNIDFLRTGFFQQRLFSEPYFCICSRSHPAAKRGQITLAQYLEAAHVSVSRGNSDSLVEQALAKKRKERRVQLRLANYHVAIDVVANTRMLGTVPGTTVTQDVCALELPFKVPNANVRQYWHRRAHHDPASMWLRELLSTMFASDQSSMHLK